MLRFNSEKKIDEKFLRQESSGIMAVIITNVVCGKATWEPIRMDNYFQFQNKYSKDSKASKSNMDSFYHAKLLV
jgi:hypothetical protein